MVRRQAGHFDGVPWKSQQYKNTVFNYQLILADMSDLQHIRGLQREMRLLDGTSPWMELCVCFACSWVFLKNLIIVYFLCWRSFCFRLHQNETHTTKEPCQNAMHFQVAGLDLIISFISGAYIVSMYSIIKVLPICLLPKQYKILLFSINLL